MPKLLYKILISAKGLLIILLMLLFRLFKIRANRIVFISYYGKGFGDNGKYIVDALKGKNVEIYWALTDVYSPVPDYVHKVKNKSLKYYYILSTSRIWINNCRFPFWVKKRKGQMYIQTWHGGFPIKKIEKSVEEKLDSEYVLSAKNDSLMVDLMLSNNGLLTKVYKNDFWYSGKIVECGCPRNDIIFNNKKNVREQVFEYFGIDTRCHICLYAPTFRRNGSLSAYSIDFRMLRNLLSERFGGKWKILVRLHPNITKKSGSFINYDEDIMDASKYNDSDAA